MQSYKKNKIVFVYFIYIILAYILFLVALSEQFPSKYVFTDWLINYEGGFIRRGLMGQISYELSNLTSLKIKNIILFFQIVAYLIYILIFIYLFSKIKINFFWLLLIFSSISFLYPIGELEALGRKDIFVLLFFLVFTITKTSNLNNLFFYFFIYFGVSCLIHEITFFYIYYYFLIIYFKCKIQLKKIINLKYYFLTLIFVTILIYLNLYVSQQAQPQGIFNSYNEKDIIITGDFGAFTWLSKSLKEHILININRISLIGIARYVFILGINILPIIYFIKIKKKFSKIKINFKKMILILILLSLPTYILAMDWGRITYLSYNFLIIFLIFIFNQKLIDIKYIEFKSQKISAIKKAIIFFSISLMFGPKILLTDDLGGIPFYQSFTKFIKLIFYYL